LLAVVITRNGEPPPKPVLPLAGDSLVRIDPATNEVVAASLLSSTPVGVAIGAGFVWVTTDDGQLVQVDPRSGSVVRSIDATRVGHVRELAAGAGGVWLLPETTGAPEELWRYDPRRARLAPASTGGVIAYGITADVRGVWFADYAHQPDSVRRLDPATGAIAMTLTGDCEAPIGLGDGAVWVSGSFYSGDHSVARIDPVTGAVIARIPLESVPTDLAAGGGALWILDGSDSVSEVDPSVGRIVARYTVGRLPQQVAYGDGAVWVTSGRDRTLTRIDPRSADLTTIPVGGDPVGVAAGRGGLWVAVDAR
jgi:streptogramin lyase